MQTVEERAKELLGFKFEKSDYPVDQDGHIETEWVRVNYDDGEERREAVASNEEVEMWEAIIALLSRIAVRDLLDY